MCLFAKIAESGDNSPDSAKNFKEALFLLFYPDIACRDPSIAADPSFEFAVYVYFQRYQRIVVIAAGCQSHEYIIRFDRILEMIFYDNRCRHSARTIYPDRRFRRIAVYYEPDLVRVGFGTRRRQDSQQACRNNPLQIFHILFDSDRQPVLLAGVGRTFIVISIVELQHDRLSGRIVNIDRKRQA